MKKETKRLIWGAAIAGGGMLVAAGLVIGAGMAHADFQVYGSEGDASDVTYLAELAGQGITGTARNAGLLAEQVCFAQADEGLTRRQEEAVMEARGYTISQEVAIVMGAEYHFCPLWDSLQDPTGTRGVIPYVPPASGQVTAFVTRGGHHR